MKNFKMTDVRQVFLLFLISLMSSAFGCDNSTSVEQIESEKPYILWGMGDQISGAKNSPVFQEAPVGMVTSWFNKPDDLNWMNGYKDETTMSNLYHQGYAQELVVWLADYPDYAISPKFQEDIVELTKIFKGNGPDYGPLYVVLFTEFETYSDDPDYFIKLKDAFIQASESIKQEYGQASVALGFGGYGWIGQAERDLKTWEIEAIEAGDFAAVQHMHHADRLDLMIPQVRRSVKQLGSYGKPVMVSHFKLWGNEGDPTGLPSQSFNNFISNIFTLQSLQALSDDGLFAWGFMDDTYINDPGTARNRIVEIISRHTDPDSELPNQ